MPDKNAIMSTAKEFILKEFLEGEDPDELTEDVELISSGILDSLATLKLVTFYLDEAAKDDKSREEAEKLRLTLLSNLAACQFQWNNHDHVIKLASKVLPAQRENVKLLYRRGVSYLERGEFSEAKNDLGEAHRLDPKNKAINEKLGHLRVREKKHKEQLANGMRKMFM